MMTFAEIGRALGISEFCAKWTFYKALRKVERECKRRGIGIEDVIGAPRNNMSRCEDYS